MHEKIIKFFIRHAKNWILRDLALRCGLFSGKAAAMTGLFVADENFGLGKWQRPCPVKGDMLY